MSKLPFMQFYPKDWQADTRALSAETKGAWIDLLCHLWNQPDRGQWTGTAEQLARVCGVGLDRIAHVIQELGQVANVTDKEGIVTVMSRRMAREEKTRKDGYNRVIKHRSNASVTPPKRNSNGEYVRSHTTEVIKDLTPTLAESQPKPLAAPLLKIHPWFIGLELYEKDQRLNNKIWKVDKSWMQTYTAVSIEGEIKKAHAWELANHSKTDRVRFLNNWLSRAQDRPRGGNFGGDKTITLKKEGGYIGHEGDPDKYANLAEKPPTQQEFEERMRRINAGNDIKGRAGTGAPSGVATHKAD